MTGTTISGEVLGVVAFIVALAPGAVILFTAKRIYAQRARKNAQRAPKNAQRARKNAPRARKNAPRARENAESKARTSNNPVDGWLRGFELWNAFAWIRREDTWIDVGGCDGGGFDFGGFDGGGC